ncbi:MAG: guanylate kinase [Cyanobacteria bacterium J06639_18]
MMQVLSIKSGATTKEQYLSSGKLMILTGPSGVGKGTLMRTLLQRHPELYYSVSATTRAPRSGETDGINYYFVSRTNFEQLVASGEFLEWAEFAGNYYGTPRQPVLEKVNSGKTVLLEIELDGARQVRTSFPQATSIFILPPSLEELEKRIRSRNQDSEDAIARRLILARNEIEAADEFDIQIVNDDFEMALCSLEKAIFG